MAIRTLGYMVAGLGMGLLGLAVGLWFYVEAVRVEQVRTAVGERLRVAREAVERVKVIDASAIRFTVRDVSLLDASDEVVVTSPRVTLTLDVPSLEGDGPIEFYDVELRDPVAHLVQSPDREWNIFRALQVTAAGQPVDTEPGRALLFRDVQVVDGRIDLLIPAGPEPPDDARFAADVERIQSGGVWYQRYRTSDVQSRLPTVRLGGAQGWRAELASLTGEIERPALTIAELAGVIEQEGDDGARFSLDRLVLGETVLAGSGLVRFPDEGVLYDLELQADPLHLADLQPVFPNLPDEGVARFDVGIESVTPRRLALDFSGLEATALDSRVTGRIHFAVGDDIAPALVDADLELAPVQLAVLEQVGLVDELPIAGQVTGNVSTEGAPAGFAAVDLSTTFAARSAPEAEPSVILASGNVALTDPAEALELDGVAVTLQSLALASLRDLLPDQAEMLRGSAQGSISLAGTLSELRLADGSISYLVDDAPPTRLAGLRGRFAFDPELQYELHANAEPIALATLTALAPVLPFRAATLEGPIEFTGDRFAANVSADLSGAAGGLAISGDVNFTEPVAFDVSGSLNAFAAGMLLRPDLPVEGPLTGSFSVQGSTEQLAFDVDLSQQQGRFTLTGTAVPSVDPFGFDVSGRVADFRVGALIGEPQLFPDPMTGPIALSGGGGDPYRFDVDLRADESQLTLEGFFLPGDVPSYEAFGAIAGLDIGRLPTPVELPSSALTGTLDIRGRGTDLNSLEGTFAFDATRSILAGLTLDAAVGRIDVRSGVMAIDTVDFRIEESRLAATGSWGLTRPAAEPLRYSFVSPDLSRLSRLLAGGALIPPQLAGDVRAEGEVAGSIENPVVVGTVEANDFRFEDWRAAALLLVVDAARTPDVGWAGEVSFAAEDLARQRIEALETLSLEASGTEGAVTFDLSARRDEETDLTASGLLELDNLTPRAAGFETITLRLGDATWQLLNPATVRYGPEVGLVVENLALERSGPVSGTIAMNGAIPPTGVANLTVNAADVDLSDINRIFPTAPPVAGMFSLDALVAGPVSDPELSIDTEVEQFSYREVTADRIAFDAGYSGRRLTGAGEGMAAGLRLFSLDASIPMLVSLEEFVPRFELLDTDPVSITIAADSIPLDLVAALIPGVSDGSGEVRAEIDVGGTLDLPDLGGWARIDNGAFTVEALGAPYSAINADLALAGNHVTINSLSARSGGTMTASGEIDFAPGSPPVVALDANLEEFRVMDTPEETVVTTSAQVALNGPTSEPVLTGSVVLSESTIQVPELTGEEFSPELAPIDPATVGPSLPAEDLAAASPALANLQVDGVELSIQESVWLESEEMRVQIDGDLVLYRVGDELRIFGALEAVRGNYVLELNSITRQFDILRGRVQFYGTGDLNASIDIEAGYRVREATVGSGGDINILVIVSGTLLAPRVQLTSDTAVPMSETDVISYLLFGQPSFELSGVTRSFAEQLLVQEVVGGFLASELERPIRESGFCDQIRIRPGLATGLGGFGGADLFSGAAIECAREISDEVFVTAQTGLGIFGGDFYRGRVGVEWQIDDQWLWEASYGSVQRDAVSRIFGINPGYQLTTDIRRRWQYGRPRQQTPIDLGPEEGDQPSPVAPGPGSALPEPTAGAATQEEPPAVAGGPS